LASLGKLVAGVAHEINTPLASVVSSHDTLHRALEKLEGHLGEERLSADRRLATLIRTARDSSRVSKDGAERVAEMVRRLRAFAGLDEAEQTKVDVREGLKDTLSIMAQEIGEGVEIATELHEIPAITCAPALLNQVFVHLFRNAAQAMSGQGRLSVRTEHAGPWVKIEVEDDGPGIPRERLERVFDTGFSTQGGRVAAGLGLAICRRIVHDHQGRIGVHSVEGEGTTVTVQLPVDAGAA
jgi:signal transduction histidine kinase